MVRVKVYRNVPRKDFEAHYGKYPYGVHGKANGHTIHLKKGFKRKTLAATLRHEMGHVFAETNKIKIPAAELRKALKERRMENVRRMKKKRDKLEEFKADMYYHVKGRLKD